MRLAINLTLSLGMLAVCLWLVWPDAEVRDQLAGAFKQMTWVDFRPYLIAFLGLQIVVHLTRSLRWNYLLAPLGVKIPPGPLLAISSVGFMAILALPARLGELVRPGLLRRRGISASAALGTVAVERIVDGLMISLFVFGACVAIAGPTAPGWMMPAACATLGLFILFFVFLVFSMSRPEATVRWCLKISLLPRVAPRIASIVEQKALDMIRGFRVLRDKRNLVAFCAWTLVYWTANGIGVWVLARSMGLPLSMTAGIATMGIVAVGISLPNAPGLAGQFHAFTLVGLSLYLGPAALDKDTALYAQCLAFAIVNHLLQVVWYVGMGVLGLATPWVSFSDVRKARRGSQTEPPPNRSVARIEERRE